MSAIPPSPRFFQQPLRYLKWTSINKPAYFYSCVVGTAGPVLVLTVPPIRRYMGEEQIAKIPMTYPSKYTTCAGVGVGDGKGGGKELLVWKWGGSGEWEKWEMREAIGRRGLEDATRTDI